MSHFKPASGFDPRRAVSEHFRLSEFTRSATADKHQLYNIPREDCEFANLRALAENVLEPARALLGAPLVITSGFRCGTLNRLIGGAPQSQHLYGEAADFIPKRKSHKTEKGPTVEEAAEILAAQDNLPFDQLIFEIRVRAGEGQSPVRWIHISHRRLGSNRHQVLSVLHTATGSKTGSGIVSLSDFETREACRAAS
ncbi:MAG: peptidase M15 [Kordiimonadales bacterium]|nr:MAG: peptidase M15 [Kordiimonadales bacterium]